MNLHEPQDIQNDVVAILRDFASGMPVISQYSGICFNLSHKLEQVGCINDAYSYGLVEKLAGGSYRHFSDLDRKHWGINKWVGEQGMLRRMFCGMAATRIERDGLDAVLATFRDEYID